MYQFPRMHAKRGKHRIPDLERRTYVTASVRGLGFRKSDESSEQQRGVRRGVNNTCDVLWTPLHTLGRVKFNSHTGAGSAEAKSGFFKLGR